jgi:hypothetical protein
VVLATLAAVLAWGSAPVRADDNDGDPGRQKVRVLTQNMFQGTNFATDLRGATTPQQFREAITAVYQKILDSKPAERAGNKPSDRTPSGLWPSDHAGIVAKLAGRP